MERDGGAFLVDEGTDKGRKILVIPPHASGRIQVRFPRLAPGYLIDVIGLRRPGFLEGLIPATSQPPYRADQPPSPPTVGGHVPDSISGTVTWHEPGEEPDDLLGLAYPALDPETGCEVHDHAIPGPLYDLDEDGAAPHGGRHSKSPGPGRSGPGRPADPGTPGRGMDGAVTVAARAAGHSHSGLRSADRYAVDPHRVGPGCVRLPYLSVGSMLRVRNDCAQRDRVLPVTSCGAAARLFCDRCVTCGTSPRGRIADLTMCAFVDLGGDLERGCFNATITIGD